MGSSISSTIVFSELFTKYKSLVHHTSLRQLKDEMNLFFECNDLDDPCFHDILNELIELNWFLQKMQHFINTNEPFVLKDIDLLENQQLQKLLPRIAAVLNPTYSDDEEKIPTLSSSSKAL